MGINKKLLILGRIIIILIIIGQGCFDFYQFRQKNTNIQFQLNNLQKDLKNARENLDPSSIIAKWRPFVAHVKCDFDDGSSVTGSGLLTSYSKTNNICIVTNKHVIVGDSGQSPVSCEFQLPENTNIYPISINGSSINQNVDLGLLRIANPDDYIKNLISTISNYIFCRKTLTSLGNRIVILGYPVNGSQTDITATEGIISGYDGNYYITSAKIEHGNSGGVAILENQNCYIGIPTFSDIGSIESLGRILEVDAMPIFN